MKLIKNKIKTLIVLISINAYAFAQNSAIFKGGTADGWTTQNFQQSSVSIFKGGTADGWAAQNYQQSSVSIFKGGTADGWATQNHQQSSVSIFKGGSGDGWASGYKPFNYSIPPSQNFTAQRQGNNAAVVQYKTSVLNPLYFDVERSRDAVSFQSIGKVKNAADHLSTATNYSFTDNQPLEGINYYRFKQVGQDGKITYTPARMVKFDDAVAGSIKYYPNPTNGILNIAITKEMQQEESVINITNAAGMMLDQVRRPSNSSTVLKIDLGRFAKGTYFIQVKTKTTNNTQRVVFR